jgi:hypothetical protein
MIKRRAFSDCFSLTVILNNGLEEVGVQAFHGCRSLVRIDIPPAVRVIKEGAFFDFSGLTATILNNKLEEIGAWVFHKCRSLVHIRIHPAIRAIKERAIFDCLGLTVAILNDALEEIGAWKFADAGPLHALRYPLLSGQSRKVHSLIPLG